MGAVLDQLTPTDSRPVTLSEIVNDASRSNDSWANSGDVIGLDAGSPSRLVSLDDTDYPLSLRTIVDPPALLNVAGSLNQPGDQTAVAIVGSRTASAAGRLASRQLASDLAKLGHTIVSGLAAGIDTEAHLGALGAGKRTIAVIGTGIAHAYPTENEILQRDIATSGAVVSLFSPDQQPSKTTFPARNVILAGFGAASVLIELAEHSGTRIQATVTVEQGKRVLLWAPILFEFEWAREYARHDLVSFVDSADEIDEILAARHES